MAAVTGSTMFAQSNSVTHDVASEESDFSLPGLNDVKSGAF